VRFASWNIRGSPEFWDALEEAPHAVRREFVKEAVLQLQLDPYLPDQRFDVVPSPDVERHSDVFHLFLINSGATITYRIVEEGRFVDPIGIVY
jgi:hypothetical protein